MEKTSAFEINGVLEGFYGRPWTHEERLDIIRFTSRFGMQSYVYAPKDDPYHRARWRDSYSGEALQRFEEMMQTAREENVEIWYAISPGLDMVYSSDDDYKALMNKMDAMIALGVANVALFVDDVPESLIHDADKEMFGSLAEAHVYVGNRLYEDLSRRNVRLALCPTTYTDAWGDREYIRYMGANLDPDIPIFWTGTDVVTGEITLAQALEWGKKLQRKPLIWDNYPVNDFDTNRLFLGPFDGRDANLDAGVIGILANPMNQPYASMIPLATLAYYVRDPRGYDPDEAIERALRELFPAPAIQPLREIVNLYRQQAHENHAFASIYRPGLPGHAATIDEALSQFEKNLGILDQISDKPRNLEGLVEELRPFLVNTKRDWQAKKENPAYYTDDQGMLRKRLDQQVLLARRAPDPITVDGHLDEWTFEGFYSLNMEEPEFFREPEMAVVYDDTYLYAGIRIYRRGPLSLPVRFFNGDHIVAMIDRAPDSGNYWVEPHDPVMLMRPYTDQSAPGLSNTDVDSDAYQDPGTMQGNLEVREFNMTGYTRMSFSNTQRHTFSWFYLNQAGRPRTDEVRQHAENTFFAWQPTSYGYSVEFAIPHHNQKEIRMVTAGRVTSWEDALEPVSSAFIISQRPFIGNTATWPVIRLVD